MFFKIYFSRRKFEQDAAALVQKQNGWAAGAYCGARILSASPDEQYISPMEAKNIVRKFVDEWNENANEIWNSYAIQFTGIHMGK